MIEVKAKILGVSIDEFLGRFGLTKESALEFIKNGLRLGVVYTHNGSDFHGDEVTALALLEIYRNHLNNQMEKDFYSKFRVIRTRQIPENFTGIVLDVNNTFLDHHFPKESAAYRENGIQYASAGILWHIIGEELVSNEYFDTIDSTIFQNIDACDNGQYGDATLSRIVSSFVPNWNENLDVEIQMGKAIEFMQTYLERVIASYNSKSIAKEYVLKDVEKMNDSRVVVLSKGMPWEETLVELNTEYVIFFNGVEWCAQVVPDAIGSFGFKNGKGFPVEWRGLRDFELKNISNIEDVVFCHSAGFFMAGKTKESMINACFKALNH